MRVPQEEIDAYSARHRTTVVAERQVRQPEEILVAEDVALIRVIEINVGDRERVGGEQAETAYPASPVIEGAILDAIRVAAAEGDARSGIRPGELHVPDDVAARAGRLLRWSAEPAPTGVDSRVGYHPVGIAAVSEREQGDGICFY